MSAPRDELLTVPSGDGLALAVGLHRCAGDENGTGTGPVLLIVHGIASHMGWYRQTAAALAARGVTTYVADRRGCGLSQGDRGHMPRWGTAVDDIERIADEVRARHPGRPLHLYGVSLGGVFCTAAAAARPDHYASVIMSSPGFATHITLPLRRRLRLMKRSVTKPRKLYNLPFGPEQLTDRPAWRAFLASDPLRTRKVTARFLVQMFLMIGHCRRQLKSLRTPLLVLLAAGDTIVDNAGVIAMLERAHAAPVSLEVQAGATHILPASVPRDVFVERLVAWMGGESAQLPTGLRRVDRPSHADESAALPSPPSAAPPSRSALEEPVS